MLVRVATASFVVLSFCTCPAVGGSGGVDANENSVLPSDIAPMIEALERRISPSHWREKCANFESLQRHSYGCMLTPNNLTMGNRALIFR